MRGSKRESVYCVDASCGRGQAVGPARRVALGGEPGSERGGLLAHELVRHAVIVPLDFDVIIDVRLDGFPCFCTLYKFYLIWGGTNRRTSW